MLFVAHVSVVLMGQLERLLQTGVKFRPVPIVLFWDPRWNSNEYLGNVLVTVDH